MDVSEIKAGSGRAIVACILSGTLSIGVLSALFVPSLRTFITQIAGPYLTVIAKVMGG